MASKARAMVLAAGHGTRLRPLTDECAKPLVPLGDRPVLGHIARRLAGAGFLDIVVNVHHRADDFLHGIDNLGAIFHPILEREILGTAGGIQGAKALFAAAPIVVWNGDILVDAPLHDLVRAAEKGGLVLAIAAAGASGEGTVGLGEHDEIVRLRGERFGKEVRGGDYVGVAALGASALAALPERGCLVGDYALPFLRAGGSIATVSVSGGFHDVGSLASYHAACLAWLAEVAGGRGSWVHPDAHVPDAVSLSCTVVGAGATVQGEGLVERCVLWPGASARAPLANTIVTTSGREVSVP